MIVYSQSPRQFPNPFNISQLQAVWRQEQQGQHFAVFAQQGYQQYGVVIAGLSENGALQIPK